MPNDIKRLNNLFTMTRMRRPTHRHKDGNANIRLYMCANVSMRMFVNSAHTHKGISIHIIIQ